jgi:hypothetical protein
MRAATVVPESAWNNTTQSIGACLKNILTLDFIQLHEEPQRLRMAGAPQRGRVHGLQDQSAAHDAQQGSEGDFLRARERLEIDEGMVYWRRQKRGSFLLDVDSVELVELNLLVIERDFPSLTSIKLDNPLSVEKERQAPIDG